MGLFLVTGGAGFIGSHLADALLAGGHDVRVLDDLSTGKPENLDPRCELVRGDVADPDAVRAAMRGAAGCFHLAAIASVARANEEWLATHRTNLTGSVTVFDAARAQGRIPVVYASSAAVYGDVGDAPASERDQPSPLTAYGADKLGAELHARVAYLVHEVPTLGLRLFNVYGPRQDPASPYSGVISIFARAIAQRMAITLHGDGAQTRDFVYVGDVAAHFVAGMESLRARSRAAVLNVCTGRGTRICDLATALGDIAGAAPEIAHGPARTGDIRMSVGSPALATRQLGIRAGVPLDEGLKATSVALAGHAADVA